MVEHADWTYRSYKGIPPVVFTWMRERRRRVALAWGSQDDPGTLTDSPIDTGSNEGREMIQVQLTGRSM